MHRMLRVRTLAILMQAYWHTICPVSLHRNRYIDGLVQERRNSSALAMELCLSSTNPWIYSKDFILWYLHDLYHMKFVHWLQQIASLLHVVVATTGLLVLQCSFINSLAPGRFEWKFSLVIFKLNLAIDGLGISCEIALRWLSLKLTDDESTLAQVMAWCLMAPSHHLSQCWLNYISTYGTTRPQWVKM